MSAQKYYLSVAPQQRANMRVRVHATPPFPLQSAVRLYRATRPTLSQFPSLEIAASGSLTFADLQIMRL